MESDAEGADGEEEPPFVLEEPSVQFAGISDAGLLYRACSAAHEALSASQSAADCRSALRQGCRDKKREAAEMEAQARAHPVPARLAPQVEDAGRQEQCCHVARKTSGRDVFRLAARGGRSRQGAGQ